MRLHLIPDVRAAIRCTFRSATQLEVTARRILTLALRMDLKELVLALLW